MATPARAGPEHAVGSTHCLDGQTRRPVQPARYVPRGSSAPAIRRIVHVAPACPQRCAQPDQRRSKSHAVSRTTTAMDETWQRRRIVVSRLMARCGSSAACRDVEAIDGLGRPSCRRQGDLRKRGLVVRVCRAVVTSPCLCRHGREQRGTDANLEPRTSRTLTSNLGAEKRKAAPSPHLTSLVGSRFCVKSTSAAPLRWPAISHARLPFGIRLLATRCRPLVRQPLTSHGYCFSISSGVADRGCYLAAAWDWRRRVVSGEALGIFERRGASMYTAKSC